MPTHVALLRGINVGGRKMVAMDYLRALLEDLKFAEVRTLLQSGNVVFQSDTVRGAALERLLEDQIEKRFEQPVTCLVRTAAEWKAIVASNPFLKEAQTDPGRLVVMCLKKATTEEDVESLRKAIRGPETVRAKEKQLYIIYPAGQGTSKLTNALIEQKLGIRGTARNWNTVLKLASAMSSV
jgi:uncharacterized protein (DUF1697 family)